MPSKDDAVQESEISHEKWERTTEAGWNNHWRHVDGVDHTPESIILADETTESLSAGKTGWTIEIYPSPDEDVTGIERFRFIGAEYDNPEQAAKERVQELMEEHALSEESTVENGLHRHTIRIKEEYPEPLNWLLVELAEYNRDEWLGHDNPKSSTFGAEEVRETGLTSNQQEWAQQIANSLEEDDE